MLQILLGGTPQSGTALADAVGISRSLASAHLKKLVDGALVTARRSGRVRLYEIASEPVATAIETLMMIAPPSKAARSLKTATRTRNLRWARMCYDHLAGVVGVAVTEALVARQLIAERDGSFVLAPRGPGGLAEFGIDVTALGLGRRPLLRECMDWTEHRHHLAGSLGAGLATELLRRGWLRSQPASRAVTVTDSGQARLRDWLGVDLPRLRAA
jgi:DNA-binding transcriptional ArsR family regulator